MCSSMHARAPVSTTVGAWLAPKVAAVLLYARFESRNISGPLRRSFVVDGAAWKFQRGCWFGRTAAGSVWRV